ncbi:DUF3253 domain-containing protein [Mucilaginibacter terrenus]|uniref:DUF3253 domain-containing protein n=1 Tax=Mucilaginibacter terrenus TaxID=2482727 RepID=A0A3E2NN02_9SPHI|nr:DUF3253 domain-containing protein [Mucilaginibacter terrenus]
MSQTILTKATERGPNKSTCPSEIARQMFPADWRNHMQEVRDAAIELQKEGKVIITQKGEPVDVDHIKGPVRISIVKL